jgi:folate-binding protein YgfZ
MYRLRAKVTIEDRSDALAVVAILGVDAGLPDERGATRALGHGIVAVDPRLTALGARAVLPVEDVASTMAELGASPLPAAAYEACRLAHGVPASSDDLVVQKSLLLESNFVELAGVAFDKGCYVGQELTARTKYRALVRKRLLPVRVDGPLPAPGTPLLLSGREAGEMRSAAGDRGMALVRLDSLAKEMPVLEAGCSRFVSPFPIVDTVPWGRDAAEYAAFFGLGRRDGQRRILDCGGGRLRR